MRHHKLGPYPWDCLRGILCFFACHWNHCHTRSDSSRLPLTMRPSVSCTTHTTCDVCPVTCGAVSSWIQLPVARSHTRSELSSLQITVRPSASCTTQNTYHVCPVSCWLTWIFPHRFPSTRLHGCEIVSRCRPIASHRAAPLCNLLDDCKQQVARS